jgi:replicative DNA helicase
MIERPIESEKALISIAMNYPEAIDEISEKVSPDAFSPAIRDALLTLKQIKAAGGVPDARHLMAEMKGHEVLILDANEFFAPVSAIDYHVGKIVDYQTKVALRHIAGEIPQLIESSLPAEDLLAEFEGKLSALTTTSAAGSYINGKQLGHKILEFMQSAREGGVEYPESGLSNLDMYLKGFRPGGLYILGARPGTGKTAFTVTVISNMTRAGHKVGMFSAEMPDLSIGIRYLAVDSNTPINRLESGGRNTKSDASLLSLVKDNRIFINDTPNIRFPSLVREARTMRRKEGIEILFVDYISLLTLPDSEAKTWEKVSYISKGLKQLARELEIPIVGLSQLTRDSQGNRPTLASIRHSGAIEEDADAVLFLHADSEYAADITPIECIVAKNRGGEVGTAELMFRKTMTKFYSKGGD